MKKEIGLWVDHRRAVIVTLEDHKETVQIILSNMENNTRFSSDSRSGSSSDGKAPTAEDIRDRQNELHLDRYYAEITYKIKEADSIMIFGPGEAKVQFAAHLKNEKLGAKIAQIETEDKMTDRQISAKVHEYFVQV
jgi:hypothetical protein